MNQAFTSSNRKAQTSLLDFMIAFLIVISTLLYVTTQFYGNIKEQGNSLEKVAFKLSNQILSEGTPKNWNLTNVIFIGISSNGTIDNSKINKIKNLSYNEMKVKLGLNTNYEFAVIFKEKGNVSNNLGCGFGNPSIDFCNFNGMPTTLSYKNLVKVVRVSSFNESPITMIVYVWD